MEPTTYVYQDGQVYTLVEGKVVTAVPEDDFVGPQADPAGEGQLDMPSPPPDVQADLAPPCPQCGKPTSALDRFCPQCGSPLMDDEPQEPGFDDSASLGDPTHAIQLAKVTTPNGLSGTVLGKTANLWGSEVTVRLENGNIVHLPVSQGFKFEAAAEKPEPKTIPSFEERLAASVLNDKGSLKARLAELESLRNDIANAVEDAKDTDLARLNEISVQAAYERKAAEASLQHLAEIEGQAFEPPAPFKMQAVEQASMGPGDGSWLAQVTDELIHEAEAIDYDKLMSEGPEAFVAGLEGGPLAEAGATRSMAHTMISEKTAAADPETRERYTKVWLARVEEARRAELVTRKAATKQKVAKQAAEEPDYSNLPDEFGFGA